MDIKLATYVALGGALGSLARYALGGWLTRGDYPYGTLAVNLLGSFLIGLLVFGGLAGGWLTPGARALLAIGVLGGFTTMSSFSYETVSFLEDRESVRGAGYVLATVAGCLAMTWVGRIVAASVWRA